MGSLSEDAKRVLGGALELIADESAWSPRGPGSARHYGDDGCTRCALVALEHAQMRAGLEFSALMRARAACYRLIGHIPPEMEIPPQVMLGPWNDASGRTHAEVLDLLRRAKEAS